jgi:hypothetical protein
MARARRTGAQWEEIGKQAILDLLRDRLVAPWAEIEARIAAGWKNFPSVQPLQLAAARRALREEGAIEEDHSVHDPPITTLRLPIEEGTKREVLRERGRKRRLYRKYLSWAGDQNLCGKHGERIFYETLVAASPEAGLYVPPQAVGDVREIDGTPVQPGPLDAFAYILELETMPIRAEFPMVCEVKNINRWIYPHVSHLWELLVKAAHVASYSPVVPVLVCMRAAWPTLQMAKDVGFFACEMRSQLFSPRIDARQFTTVRSEFALTIEQADQPPPSALTFLRQTLRMRPPPTPPEDEDLPWYRRQADRFSAIAPAILNHNALAGTLDVAPRRRAFRSFRASVQRAATWPLVAGW